MLSIQQLMKALKKLQNNTVAGGELVKSIKHVAICANNTNQTYKTTTIPVETKLMTSLYNNEDIGDLKVTTTTTTSLAAITSKQKTNSNTFYTSNDNDSSQLPLNEQQQQLQQTTQNSYASQNKCFSLYSPLNADSSQTIQCSTSNANTQDTIFSETLKNNTTNCTSTSTTTTTSYPLQYQQLNQTTNHYHSNHHPLNNQQKPSQRSQSIQNFFQQQIFQHQFHTQHNQNLNTKQKQTQFAMSSLAAEPLTLQKSDNHNGHNDTILDSESSVSSSPSSAAAATSSSSSSSAAASCSQTKQVEENSTTGKPCFNTGLGDILQFMELIGNLKHTKRTGWVLRNVNDCESISGHMYRMSILTFLLDGSEGLNQIRCMELALVHDLAESLVGDITPFCGISKEEKKNMEFKAMEDICKLIEPRGKRMMELFEEYEQGESPESRFVKDLDRLDMVMQAFEYEKRDDCLLKHQEFFDSTEGKFNHPFVKKLVNEIYEQRNKLAKAKGAVPPPKIEVPNMDDPTPTTNGHCSKTETTIKEKTNNETTKTS